MSETKTRPSEQEQAQTLAAEAKQSQDTATEVHPDEAQVAAQNTAQTPDTVPTADQTVADKTARAFKIVDNQVLIDRLRQDTLTGIEEVLVTLEVAQHWFDREDSQEHLDQVKNGIGGAIEQLGRVRSRLGSTQTP